MIDAVHDPGPERTAKRVEDLPPDVAAEPIHFGAGGTTAKTGTVRIGTASWTDPTMTAAGVFYPEGADSAEERLAYYASRFPLVEVDATYYALPSRRTAELWVERTPPDFIFDIKAHALMTGQPTETKRLPKDLREALPLEVAVKPRIYAKDLPDALRDDVWAWFADGLEPLKEAGQLGSILLQYPRWFFTSSENRDQIEEAVGRLREAGMTGAVEFRSASWFNEKNLERTLDFLGDRDIPMVIVDGPQGFKSSVPAVVAATSPISPSCGFTAAGPRPGRRRVSRPSSGSATCTTATSSRSGRRACRRRPARRRTPTSSSTTATRTTARRTRSNWRSCSSTSRRPTARSA